MDEQLRAWDSELTWIHQRIARHFYRSEPRQRVLSYLRGLLSPIERKNGWQLAEYLGEARPDGIQRLMTNADWNADSVRDDLRTYVIEHFGSHEAVLILDETGFLKKGTHSVGVKRQYSGTAGRIENCQVGVFLCYATSEGAAFLDRALYLPEEWAKDMQRREEAGVPESVAFATKPQLAQKMLARAFEAEVPCRWVIADTVYRSLRHWLEEHRQPFVLAVPSDEPLWWKDWRYVAASKIAAQLPPEAWQRLSAGDGSKGLRLYDWAWTPLWRLQLTDEERTWGHWLLVRRNLEDSTDVAFYVVFAPNEGTTLDILVRVAGMRWHIESAFEGAKGECGLDEYEVRKWDAWHRYITLSLLAHAVLAVIQAREKGAKPPAS